MKEQIQIIVNEHDEEIWYKHRSEITSDDIYRVSSLWIENSKGEILMAQRWFMKTNWPGRWWPAVAGTIDKWESYEENIYKEAEEEIGLVWKVFKEDIKLFRDMWNKRFFNQWYTLILDRDISDFILEKPEVESIRWFSQQELRNLLKNCPAILAGRDFIKKRVN